MSYAVPGARPFPPPRPYGTRPGGARAYGVAPVPAGFGASPVGVGAMGGALGALGGTLGCLLCLAAIGALGLFSCVVAITAYTSQFLNAFQRANGISAAPAEMQIGLFVLLASLLYTFVSRMQRS